jgi:hypothetical protein
VGGAGSAGREKLNVDLLMVRNRVTGRFIYTEQLEQRPGETTWEYARHSVRREAQVRDGFKGETLQVMVGWGRGPSRNSWSPTRSTGRWRPATAKPGEA